MMITDLWSKILYHPSPTDILRGADLWSRIRYHPSLEDQIEQELEQARAEGARAARKKFPNPSSVEEVMAYSSEINHRRSQVMAKYLIDPPIEVLTEEERRDLYPLLTYQLEQEQQKDKETKKISEEQEIPQCVKKMK